MINNLYTVCSHVFNIKINFKRRIKKSKKLIFEMNLFGLFNCEFNQMEIHESLDITSENIVFLGKIVIGFLCFYHLTQTIFVHNIIYFYLWVRTIEILTVPSSPSSQMIDVLFEWIILTFVMNVSTNINFMVESVILIYILNIAKIYILGLLISNNPSVMQIYHGVIMCIYQKYEPYIMKVYVWITNTIRFKNIVAI